MNHTSDQELIVQIQDGSLEALGVLYDHYRMLVYRTALAITGDREAASDLLQDVFIRLFRFANHIDASRPLEPWLYRMTANLSYTWVKRSRRWLTPLEDLADRISSAGRNAPYEQVERNDEWQEVQQAISALPLQQRMVVVLYYLNDLTLQEISDILDVPVGTVKSRLHYGRLALKKSLGMQPGMMPDFKYETP